MKKVLSVLVALLLIAVACVPAFAADAYKVDVESSADTAAVGDVITVSFKVSSGLSGFKGVLEYNTENYKYVAGSAEATDLFTTEINDTVDGKITVASVASEAKDAGVVFTAKFKVLKKDGVFKASATDAIDGTNAAVTVNGDELAINITDKGAKAPETTAPEAKPDNNKNSVDIKKTGGKLYVSTAAAVAVCAAAVAVTMKKKNED
ncbi:MAG: hypothetical protein MR823_00715 [Ruminococcus sp.]|nr:hypothetical protein [Ruminococcus sp.]MDY4909634.1 hypothetical protein [Candidatus Fimenecus sp.]